MASLAGAGARYLSRRGWASIGRRWGPAALTLVVFAWSLLDLVSMAFNHTTGAELYGLAVAGVTVLVAGGSLALLIWRQRAVVATGALLVLWVAIAVGGIGGTIAHVVGPDPNHPPIDTRPRPTAAPLIFTAFGLVGAGSVFYAQRRKPE